MKTLQVILITVCAALLFDAGRLYGVIHESRHQAERMRTCLEEASVIPDSEVCAFLKANDFKCHARPRISQAYWSHKVLSCLNGLRGEYWGRP